MIGLDEFIAKGLEGIFINPLVLGIIVVVSLFFMFLSMGLQGEALAVATITAILVIGTAIPALQPLYLILLVLIGILVGMAFIRFMSR